MTDCWMDPYGNVYEVPEFGHDQFATDYLQKEFPLDDLRSWCESPNFYGSYQETLEKRGWIRFTTTLDRWSCEHSIGFEDRYPRPTRAQIDKMYELTGFNYDDPESFSVSYWKIR